MDAVAGALVHERRVGSIQAAPVSPGRPQLGWEPRPAGCPPRLISLAPGLGCLAQRACCSLPAWSWGLARPWVQPRSPLPMPIQGQDVAGTADPRGYSYKGSRGSSWGGPSSPHAVRTGPRASDKWPRETHPAPYRHTGPQSLPAGTGPWPCGQVTPGLHAGLGGCCGLRSY